MRIALFLPNWVGDAVMATPAIRAIREQFPGAELIGVGKTYVAGVLEGSPRLSEWIDFDRRGRAPQRMHSVARQFAHPTDRHCGDFSQFVSIGSGRVAGTLSAARRIHAYWAARCLLTDRLSPVRNGRGRIVPSPIILEYNRLAEQIGATVRSLQMELFTTREDEKQADGVWRRNGFAHGSEVIAINPGAAFGSAKLWPASYFADLARRYIDERGSEILILCGPAERELARQIVRTTNRRRVFSLADEHVSLGLTKACIRRCNLLVSTDSGPRHFAAAFNRPVVALFGPTFINWTEYVLSPGDASASSRSMRAVPAAAVPSRPPLHERAYARCGISSIGFVVEPQPRQRARRRQRVRPNTLNSDSRPALAVKGERLSVNPEYGELLAAESLDCQVRF